MDLRQLRHFCAIVDAGGFRRAADLLHLSPPALSLSVKRLEDELGLKLLERKPGHVQPTAFGHSLYASAQRIHAEVQAALDRLNELRGIGTGRLAVGILPYGIPSAMGRLIGRFCERYPGIEVQTALGSFSFLLGRLRDGELDFVVTEIPPGDATAGELVREPLFRLRYGLVVGQRHPLAGKRHLSLARVLDYRLAYAQTWRAVLDNWDATFAAEDLAAPQSFIGEATDEFFRDLVANGNTVAVLPMIGTIREGLESGQLVELHVPRVDWSSTVALVYRPGEGMSPDARLLLDETREALSALQP